MESYLRPLTMGEILDRTAQLYRSNFVLFAGIFSVYCGATLILNLLVVGLGELLRATHRSGLVGWVTIGGSVVEMLILFILIGPVLAAISRAVAWVNLGEPATIRGAYISVMSRFGRYLWLMTITGLVVSTPIVLLYGGLLGVMAYNIKGFGTPEQLTSQQASMTNPQTAMILGISFLVFFLLIWPVGIYTVLMSLRYALALPACVVENLKARQALRRAIDLSQGSRGRIFILGLLVGVIKLGLVGITQIFVIVGVVKNHGQLGPGLTAVSQVIAFFTNTFLGPIYATGITLFYYDQRIRKEGFDIEWMMQAAGLTAPAHSPALPVQPASSFESLHASHAEPTSNQQESPEASVPEASSTSSSAPPQMGEPA